MMTTSGFLSPAREGKLPESRTPLVSIDPAPQTNNIIQTEPTKRPVKIIRKIEKKRDRVGKELFKSGIEDKIKKITTMKDIVKLKQSKVNNNLNQSLIGNSLLTNNETRIHSLQGNKLNISASNQVKFNKALEAARLKTEKLNTTITPIPIKSSALPIQPLPQLSSQLQKHQHSEQQQFPLQQTLQHQHQQQHQYQQQHQQYQQNHQLQYQQQHQQIHPPQQHMIYRDLHVDKLFTEPDKKKINILKKISNVKNEKLENKIMKIKDEIKQESRESSPDLIIDEAASEIVNKVHHLSNDITIELIEPSVPINKSPEKVERYYDDDSPPGTPSTPKTPEMITQSPPLTKEKRKRKDKSKVKKVQKQPSPNRIETDIIDIDLDRPKTPEAPHVDVKPNPPIPFPFFPNFSGPGLIPSLNNPLFTHIPLPPLNIPSFGQPPYIPPVHPGMPMNFIQQIKQEEPAVKPTIPQLAPPVEKPVVNVPEKEPFQKLEKKGKEHKKEKKEKVKKKNKKDKLKSKAEKKKLKEEKKEKIKKEKKDKRKDKEIRDGDISVPKLTLKLGSPSPRPETPETRKLNIKPVVKKEEDTEIETTEVKREMSPELAKISALVTGQPKPKSNNINNSIISADNNFSTDSYLKKPMFKPIPKIRTKEIKKEPQYDVDFYNTPSSYIIIHAGRGMILNSLPSTILRRLKLIKSEEEVVKEEISSIVSTSSVKGSSGPGRPRIHSIKPKPTKTNKQLQQKQQQQQQQRKQQILIKDAEGNKVWICPACGRQDDGTPMIGCDDCDAWYHWVCVGIQVPPDDNEDWYCRNCINKKQKDLQTKEKRKRKKREKKDY